MCILERCEWKASCCIVAGIDVAESYARTSKRGWEGTIVILKRYFPTFIGPRCRLPVAFIVRSVERLLHTHITPIVISVCAFNVRK